MPAAQSQVHLVLVSYRETESRLSNHIIPPFFLFIFFFFILPEFWCYTISYANPLHVHYCPCHTMYSSLNHRYNYTYLGFSKKYLHLQGLKAPISSILTFDTNNKPQMQQFPLGGAQDLFLSSPPCMNLPITPYLILDGSHSWPLPCNINALSSLF